MVGWVLGKFSGKAPRVAALNLPDSFAQVATNCVLTSGAMRPLRATTPVLTLPKAGPIQSIYRFGQDLTNEAQFWFHWAADTNVVRGPISGDTQERTYFTTAGLPPQMTDSIRATTGGALYPMVSYNLGVPTPLTAPGVTLGGTPVSATVLPETRVYLETYVTTFGEEGSPSPPSASIDVRTGETVALTLSTPPTGAYSFQSRRIYRLATGSLGAGTYQFVAEVPIATNTFTDTLLAADLGEALPSLGHEPPPANMSGLVSVPGGVMAGFVGRDVYFSEPYKPHAWPVAYSMTVDAPIVALGVYGTTVLILTTANPVLVVGSHPSNYSMIKADVSQSCVSKRSVAYADGGVVYASPDGLFQVSGSGFRNLTESLFTRIEWQALGPSTVHGYIVDNKYIGFYGGTSGFILDLATNDFVSLDWYASAGYYDAKFDKLYLVTGGTALVSYDTGAPLTAKWKSKVFYSPHGVSLAAGRVIAAVYPLTMEVFADGVLKHTQSVTSSEAFRLPAGFRANMWELQLTSTSDVYMAGFAESVKELSGG